MENEITSTITIESPLEGKWKFLCPPGHHPNAFDFVKTSSNSNRTHKKRTINFLFGQIDSSDYYCWEKSVLSPVNGEVIRSCDGWKDHKYTNLWSTISIWYNATYKFRPKEKNGQLDIRPNAGNHIMIKTNEGHIVFLAHLKNGSTLVKEGQRVEIGEKIGLVGNSGNSTAPHLHINIFDQMDNPYKAKVLPFVFKQYETLNKNNIWEKNNSSVPVVGSFVKFGRITNQSKGTPKSGSPY